jgi:UDP-GlcNAc3NAcA epimerase
MKIVTILGARPQFIKAGSVSREIKRQREEGRKLEEVIIHTGQHYDANMSDIFFDEMKIPKPDYFLDINGLSHGAMTGQMLEKIEAVLQKEKPDWVLVYGDTNSTLAGALAASKLHISIAHVEAGLRSFNMRMPEEVNRILTDRVSSALFCPTETAVDNLKKEGFPFVIDGVQKVLNVGDVMQDGALFYSKLAVAPNIDGLPENGYVLATVHRAENTDDSERLASIFSALSTIAEETPVILPMHPRTKKIIQNTAVDIKNLTISDPVGYLQMVWLIKHASLIMTDSGGLQKEAYFFSKFCITLRDETEWVELVSGGVNFLAGADKVRILETYRQLKEQTFPSDAAALYGRGDASAKIVAALFEG